MDELKTVQQDSGVTALVSVTDSIIKQANQIVVTDEKSEKVAITVLSAVKSQADGIDKTRRIWVDPHNTLVKRINEFFGAPHKALLAAESGLKAKLLAYQIEKDRKAKEEEKKILDKAATGKIKPTTAVSRLAAITPVESTIKTDEGDAITYRIVKKAVITDKSKLPREYLVPSLALIEAALKAGKEVAGAKMIEEKIPSLRKAY